ncbi:MAG: protein phosphatase CheZ [Gammaproteobacteria bacterium]|nr:protein phosphatase CheZ [Gammaproteobacteria bacterium]
MLEENKLISDDNIARTKDLLACLERGDENGAREVLDELTRIRETELYQEMGKLTRELHDSLTAFGKDDQLINLAQEEIPDARSRLRYVIKMTDDAAHRTLTAVEESMPICEDVTGKSSDLHEKWRRFVQRDMNVQEFRELSLLIDKFLEGNTDQVKELRNKLNEILMAQDFQDLTSQIIKRVIGLVEEVEDNLVNLVKLAGGTIKVDFEKTKNDHSIEATGPAVPGVDDHVVSGQDEVDELLSSLGF